MTSSLKVAFNILLGGIVLIFIVAHSFEKPVPVPLERPDRGAVSAIIRAAEKYDVPSDLAVAVAFAESKFNCRATSHAGARGVAQVMPAMARRFGVDPGTLHSCSQGADAGMQILRQNYDTCGQDISCTLSLYNSGRRRADNPETKHYVSTVLAMLNGG